MLPDPDRYCTKFVEDAFFDATMNGHLKFGTLASYKSGEQGAEDRLTDDTEGVVSDTTPGNVHIDNTDFRGQIHIVGGNFSGPGAAIAFTTVVQAYVYCASNGPYREALHRAIHARNPSLTAYVQFDLAKLQTACEALYDRLHGGRPSIACCSLVEYPASGREVSMSPEELAVPANPREQWLRALFTKPLRFKHEEEVRIGIAPPGGGHIEPIYVKDLGPEVVSLFEAAVIAGKRLPVADPFAS